MIFVSASPSFNGKPLNDLVAGIEQMIAQKLFDLRPPNKARKAAQSALPKRNMVAVKKHPKNR